jgi:acyl carrier protein
MATTALTYEQVMEKLPAIVAECLAVDLEEITPELVFYEDSIDLLDLSFRCEKAYGVKAPFRLFVSGRDLLTVNDDGCLTPDALQVIRETYPFFAARYEADCRTNLKPVDLLQYFTVDMVARFVVEASVQQAANAQAA